MRTLTLALLFFAQAQTYPPPYPRAGVTKLKPHVTFVTRGTVHNDEQTSGADRVFAFEVK